MPIGPFFPARWLITTPDLADDPDVFPLLPGQSFLSNKTPGFSTTTKEARSGRKTFLANWSSPIWTFKTRYEFLRDKPPSKNELQRLWGFFANRFGAWGGFYYFDPRDNLVTDQTVATGNGVQTTFQLVRDVAAGTSLAFREPIYVLNGYPALTVAGTPVTGFVLGPAGSVIFDTAPANGSRIAWTGSFMFLCHFTQDNLSTEQLLSDVWSDSGLGFESLKP